MGYGLSPSLFCKDGRAEAEELWNVGEEEDKPRILDAFNQPCSTG